MSQGLNRIRSLVSEIEQIQRQGRKAPRTPSFEEARILPFAAPPKAEPIETRPVSSPEVSTEAPPRVSLQWSGSVVVDLTLPQSNESLQLRQVGDSIEIRFSDGKAVHIPFKAVA